MLMTSLLAHAHDHHHHDHVDAVLSSVSLETALFALASVSLLSLLALFGIFFLSMRQEKLDRMVSYLVALAAGAMLGNAAFHLLPESFEKAPSHAVGGLLMLVGFIGCYVLEKWLNLRCNKAHGGCALKATGAAGNCGGGNSHSHAGHNHGTAGCGGHASKDAHDHEHGHEHDHAHGDEPAPAPTHRHFGGHGHAHRAEYIHPTGWMSLFSHSLHNFGDGALIAIAFMTSIPVGIATTIAIVLHEIPMELGEFGVLINAGFKRKSAIFVNMISGVVALIGTSVTLVLGSAIEGMSGILTPIGAGTVVYIAACGLIPQLQKEPCARKSRLQFAIMALGILAMFLVGFME